MFYRTKLSKNTGRAWLSLVLLLALSPLPTAAAGNFSVSPYLDYDYSSNIFWDASAINDTVFSPGLELNLASGPFTLFLDANGKIYQNNDFLNRSLVSGGFNFFNKLSERSSFFISPDFTLTRFKGEMSYLDTAIPSLVIGLKHVLSDKLYGRIGFNLRFSSYRDQDSYDHWRASAFGELSAFFKTQTTLRLSMGLNYLFFPHIAGETATAASASAPAAVTAFTGRRRYAPAMPPDPRSSGDTASLSFPQPYIVLRAAQGLGYKTGLIAEIQYRQNRNMLESFDALAVDEWALQQMDEDFFWQGTRLSLALKTEAVLNLEIAVDLSYLAKQYDGLPALDIDGGPLQPLAFRADRLSQVTLKIARSLGKFALYLSAAYRDNISNDPFFDYDLFMIATGIDYVF